MKFVVLLLVLGFFVVAVPFSTLLYLTDFVLELRFIASDFFASCFYGLDEPFMSADHDSGF